MLDFFCINYLLGIPGFPPGMPYINGFVRIIFSFFFLPPPRFPDDNF